MRLIHQTSSSAFNNNREIAKFVLSIRHTTCTHAVCNKNGMVISLCIYQSANSNRIKVMAVANSLCIGTVGGHCSANHTWLTVVKTAHAVIGMNKDVCTSVYAGKSFLIRCIGVTKCNMNTAVCHLCTELWSAIALWSNSNLGNPAVGTLLPLIKDLYIWIKEVRRILGTLVFLGKERSL